VAVTAETRRAVMDETMGRVGAPKAMAGDPPALVENVQVQ
jgi:hypothetical protein